MYPKNKIYICLECCNGSLAKDKIIHTDCSMPYCIMEADVTLKVNRKRSRWHRFSNWILSRDFAFILAFIGLLGLYLIFNKHFVHGMYKAVLEGFFVGLIIPRILR